MLKQHNKENTMAKTLNIGKILIGFNGKAILNEKEESVTVKDILLQYAGMYVTKDGKEVIRARMVGQKIFDTPDLGKDAGKLKLEEADFELLEKMIATPSHPALVFSRVLEVMDEAKQPEVGDQKSEVGRRQKK